MQVNKKLLADQLADQTPNMTKAEAFDAISIVFSDILYNMKSGNSVNIPGFGKFDSKLRKGKTGKAPGSNKTYTTQDKMVPKFTPSSVLIDAVASGKLK